MYPPPHMTCQHMLLTTHVSSFTRKLIFPSFPPFFPPAAETAHRSLVGCTSLAVVAGGNEGTGFRLDRPVCVYICVCMYTSLCVYTYACIHTCMLVYICIHADIREHDLCSWYVMMWLCMMMWHYVWWCGSVYDDVTLGVMMWHYVWWCDSMHDDVALCLKHASCLWSCMCV